MKKPCLLGLACLFLHAGVSFSQQPSFPPTPSPMPPQLPPIVQEGSPPPVSEAFSGVVNGGSAPCYRIWASSEFLLWRMKDTQVNTPLLTQTPGPVASNLVGLVTNPPNSAALLGGQSFDQGNRYGGRFTIGSWIDSDACVGVEANYLFIAPKSTTRMAGIDGSASNPTLIVPFQDTSTGTPSGYLLGGPGNPANAFLHLSNELQGGEVNLVGRLIRCENLNVTGVAGFRYLNFNENLDYGTSNQIPGAYALTTLDSFHAQNNFYGGNLGLRTEYNFEHFFVAATAKVALGVMQQSLDVNGSSSLAIIGAGPNFNFANAPGGFFAQPSNIGRHTHNVFEVVPEADLKFGYNFTRNIQGFVGYNFLYLNDVARPGALIDHNINSTQAPGLAGFPNTPTGPTAPNFAFSRSDFWAQGVNVGLMFKF